MEHSEVDNKCDTILRVCSYHRRDFDLVVVRSRPHSMQLVQASLETAFDMTSTPTAAGLDQGVISWLDHLPAELVCMILRELDVRSLFYLRHVNRRARALVTNGLWEYKLVAKYGLEGLRGLLRSGLAQKFTIDDLYQPLVTDACSVCGGFGTFLFLPAAERCCFACLQSSDRYRVVPPYVLVNLARLPVAQLGRLSIPTLRTVPGLYDMLGTNPAKRPAYLIFEEEATRTLLSSRAIGQEVVQALSLRKQRPCHRFMAATAYPYYDLRTATIDRGVSCKGCAVRLERKLEDWDDRDQIFSKRGFLSHFTQCGETQDLWAESEGGTRPINESELTRRCGYFSTLGSDGLLA